MTQPGLLGWLDPSGTLSGPLGDWASAAGARRVLSEGPFSLWQWPDSTARIFDHGARCGALLGGPFGVDGDAALDQVFSALEAKAFHRLNGHLLLDRLGSPGRPAQPVPGRLERPAPLLRDHPRRGTRLER